MWLIFRRPGVAHLFLFCFSTVWLRVGSPTRRHLTWKSKNIPSRQFNGVGKGYEKYNVHGRKKKEMNPWKFCSIIFWSGRTKDYIAVCFRHMHGCFRNTCREKLAASSAGPARVVAVREVVRSTFLHSILIVCFPRCYLDICGSDWDIGLVF
jgi:hypothetical protein